jgi:predicted transcriptional regulator
MSVTLSELEDFHRFARQRLRTERAESLEELCDLWRIEHPSAEERADIDAAIRQGLADIEAGRGRPAMEITDELLRKHGIHRE